MKKYFYIINISFALFIISCREINYPPENKNPIIPAGGCSIQGVEVFFSDTCSYDFIMSFISGFDSVTVTESFLGSVFYLSSDSGTYQYWQNYFDNDLTIESISGLYPKPDSLILAIKVSGQKTVEEEKQRFLLIEHLTIIDILTFERSLFLNVPEGSEEEWRLAFEEYPFIRFANVVIVCTDS